MKVDPNAGSLIAAPVNENRVAGLAKGRATQAHAQGKISTGEKSKIHAQADRAIGHTFHSHKGTKYTTPKEPL